MSHDEILIEERHDLPLVHFQIVLPTGSLEDPEGKEGLTRITARLMRRGTEAKDERALEELIDGLGGELTIETAPGHVRLLGSVITRSLEPMLAVVGEVLHTPSLREEALGQQRRETHAALVELTDSDSSLASIHFRRALFAGHPYGRSSIGSHASLDALTLDDVRATYETRLRVMKPIIGFAGDITPEQADRLARLHLLRPYASRTERMKPPEPSVRKGRHLRIVDKPERTQTQIQIGRLGTFPHDADHDALVVGNAVFGGTFTSRLMRAVRSERGWSYGASSRLGIGRVRDAFSMWTFPAAKDAAACMALQLELMQAWTERGIDEDELAFAKSYLSKSYAFATDTADKRLEQAIEQVLYDLPHDYFSRYTARIAEVGRDEVNEAVRSRLDPSDLVMTVVATESELGEALRALPGISSSEVVAFDG